MSMHFSNDFVLSLCVAECYERSLVVTEVPFWFTCIKDMWVVSGTDIDIIDYIGTCEVGILYLSKPIKIAPGKKINITYKH